MSNDSPFNQDTENELISNLYVAGIANRLRELENPSQNDCQRWVWELLQNAKDTRSDIPNSPKVDIVIECTDEFVIFKHNGAPFTSSSFTGLMYKYSSEKENKTESTGRFGTGFMTTHTLSKVIEITAPIYSSDKRTVNGFKTTMYRDGKTKEELYNGIMRMKNQYQSGIETNGWTTFKYLLKSETNKFAKDHGIKSFYQNIEQTLLFCPTLGKITLINNGESITIEQVSVKHFQDSISLHTFETRNKLNQITKTKTFVLLSHESPNKLLSDIFSTKNKIINRNLRMNIAVEVDQTSKNIISNAKKTCLFCTFPLIGSENHQLPFYFNSPDFEPDTERQSLLFVNHGADSNEVAINKMIFKESLNLFSKLICFLQNQKYGNLQYLTNGILNILNIKNFDSYWYNSNFVISVKKQLENKIIINITGNESCILKQALFPIFNGIEDKQSFHSIILQTYQNVPKYDDAIAWNGYLWDSIPSITLSSFLSSIDPQMSIQYFNQVIKFVKNHDRNLFNSYQIIPNNNRTLCYLKQLKKLGDIPNAFIETLKDIFGYDINNELIHLSITEISPNKTAQINDYIETINNAMSYSVDRKKALALIRFLPRKDMVSIYHTQIDMYKISSLFCQNFPETITINSYDERFWSLANNFIKSQILQEEKNYKKFSDFHSKIFKNESEAINFLNLSGKYLSNGGYAPNILGEMRPANTLSISENIPIDIINFLTLVKKDDDIRAKLADSRIINPCLLRTDMNYIFKEMQTELQRVLENDEHENDHEIMEAVRKLNFQNKNLSKKFFSPPTTAEEKARRNLLKKVFISNVKNRLNELDNPNEHDMIRWPYELIQNAKDSIVNTAKKSVDITIKFTDDYVDFIHNGAPFTAEAMLGLLYKYSEGKESPAKESTGRFGTGFLTTHTLSKNVNVQGDVYIDDERVHGFTVTIDREGKTAEDFERSIDKMEASKKYHNKPFGETKFHYPLRSSIATRSRDLGINSLRENMSLVLLFCPTINSITIIDHHQQSTFCAKNKEGEIREIQKTDSTNIDRFVFFTMKKYSEELSNYYHTYRELTINIALPIDKDNRLKYHTDRVSLYCSFPLIGSQKHKLPFFIDSPDFEPTIERNALVLHGSDKNELTNELTTTGINRIILMESVCLFKKMIDYVSNIPNISNLPVLADGLKDETIQPYTTFDITWNKCFLGELKNVILNSTIVRVVSGQKTLFKDIYFPHYMNLSKNKDTFHNIITTFYDNHEIACYEDSIEWENYLWDELPLINPEKFIQDYSSETKCNDIAFNDKILKFVHENCKEFLKQYPLIPDLTLQRQKKSKNFKECKNVSDEVLLVLNSLNIEWDHTHMHKDIRLIKLPEDTFDDALRAINDKISIDKSLSYKMASFILKGNQTREKIYKFTQYILGYTGRAIYVTSIPNKLWEESDKVLLQRMMKQISNYTINDVKRHISIINEFLPFVKDDCVEAYSIVPNIYGELNKLSKLKNISNLPQLFVEALYECFDYDCHQNEIHPEITSITCPKVTLSSYINIIDSKFQSINESTKLKFSGYIISLIPGSNNNELHKRQKNLFTLFFHLINKNITQITTNCIEANFWKTINTFSIQYITNLVEQCTKLSTFMDKFMLDEGQALEMLNILYQFTNEGKIVPNREGDFYTATELLDYGDIPQPYIEFMIEVAHAIEDKNKVLHPKVKHTNISKINQFEFLQLLNQAFDKAMSDENIRQNKKWFQLFEKLHSSSFDSKSLFSGMNGVWMKKLYVANIKNELMKLKDPKENDFLRWPWELVQNAKDSLKQGAGQSIEISNIGKVKLNFEFGGNFVSFTHDGSPFTNETRYALFFGRSEGKETRSECVGRFGTGFITTHLLSKEVEIESDIYTPTGELFPNSELPKVEPVGFSITMNRNGNTENELKRNFEKMLLSDKKYKVPFNYTKYKYQKIPSENTKFDEAYKKGLKSLMEYTPQVLIFSPTIEYIEINDNGTKIRFQLDTEESTEHLKIVNCTKDDKLHQKYHFVVFSSSDPYEKPDFISKEFQNIDISVAVIVDQDYNMIEPDNQALYSSFPLFNADIRSPMLIHSPNFETTIERDTLFNTSNTIDLQQRNEGSNNIMILLKSVKLFEELVKYLSEKKGKNYFYLAKYLKNPLSSNVWYKTVFIPTLQQILFNSKIFMTNDGPKTGQEANIPMIMFPLKKHSQAFYSIVIDLYSYSVSYEDSVSWNKYLWDDFGFITVSSVLTTISNLRTIYSLKQGKIKSEIDQFRFINNLITFCIEYDKTLLEKNEIIPNVKGSLCKYSEQPEKDVSVKSKSSICPLMTNILVKFNTFWENTHIHPRISNEFFKDEGNIEASLVISQKMTELVLDKKKKSSILDFVYFLLNYVLKGDAKRKKIHQFIYDIFVDKVIQDPIPLENVSLLMWSEVDKIIIPLIAAELENLGRITNEITGIWINDFIEIALSYKDAIHFNIDELCIIPNQKGNFMFLHELSLDNIQIEEIKELVYRYCSIDVKSQLLNQNINHVKSDKILTIDDLDESICQKLANLQFDDQFEFSKTFIKYIPNESVFPEQHQKQIEIFGLYKKMFNITQKSIPIIGNPPALFGFINQITAKYIVDHMINKDGSEFKLNHLCVILDERNDGAIAFLNRLYKYTKEGRIFPNQIGIMCELNQIFYNVDAPKDLVEVFDNFFPDKRVYSLLSHSKIYGHFIDNKITCHQLAECIDEFVINRECDINSSADQAFLSLREKLLRVIRKNNIGHEFPKIMNKLSSKIPSNLLNLFLSMSPEQLQVFDTDLQNQEIELLGQMKLFEHFRNSGLYKQVYWDAIDENGPIHLKSQRENHEYTLKYTNNRYSIWTLDQNDVSEGYEVYATERPYDENTLSLQNNLPIRLDIPSGSSNEIHNFAIVFNVRSKDVDIRILKSQVFSYK